MKSISGISLIDRFGMEYFQNASVFGALSATVIEFLLDNGRVLKMAKGDVVYRPGDKGDKFYVVLQGSLSFYHALLRINDSPSKHSRAKANRRIAIFDTGGGKCLASSVIRIDTGTLSRLSFRTAPVMFPL